MITFRNSVTLLIMLVLVSGIAGCSGGFGGGQLRTSSLLSSGRNWQIILTRLKVLEAQEDRSLMGVPLSDGDEPYIVMFGVQSTFGTSGSTVVQINNFRDQQWNDHLKVGQQRTIPVGMGSLRFENVSNKEVVGIVAIALESDRTPWKIIENRVELVKEDLKAAVARSVEGRREVDYETTAFIDELHQAMQEAVGPIATPLTTGQALENIIFSGVDTDEVIGVNSMIFMKKPPTRSLNYPHYRQSYLTDVFTNRDFLFNSNALVFQSGSLGAKYEVELRVREL
ncbi:MAG: hypothetical protein AB8G77_00100 [Rhodothermales bacterium]